jgi:hypothetical protein
VTDNPALLVRQPIGYVVPDEGEQLTLGLLMPHQPEPPMCPLSAGVTGGAQLSPQPFTGPGSGVIVTGFGQARTPLGFAPLIGLNCT